MQLGPSTRVDDRARSRRGSRRRRLADRRQVGRPIAASARRSPSALRPGSRPSGRCRRAARRAARWSATRRRRSGAPRSRRVAHSACQAPSGRSSTLVAAARCRVAARAGAGQRGPPDQHRQHRVGLVRHRRRAAAGALRRARRSRAGTAWRRRWRSGPRRRCSATSASPSRVTGAATVCQGGRGARPSAAASPRRPAATRPAPGPAVAEAASSVAAARVPAAPPTCTGQRRAPASVVVPRRGRRSASWPP